MAGLYIHIPFCKKKCNYCDFCSYVKDENTISLYLTALKREIDTLTTNHSPLSTIYIGGGTPSLLNLHQLEFLFGSLLKNLDFNKIEETSFECNPESITEEKLNILKNFGVSRLCFGLQSTKNEILSFLGRVHTFEDFLHKFEISRKLGFKNINIDLIYGIPGQSLDMWKETLKDVVKIKPEHLSIYCLSIEDGTEFQKMGVSVDENLSADMYEYAIDYLENEGYIQYEISNFSLAGFECKHNINYWQNGEYFGFGCSAVSYLNGVRKKNTSDLELYIKTSGKKTATEEMETNSYETILSEKIFLGLRMNKGIILTEEIENKYGQVINKFIEEGFLKLDSDRISLTKNGLFVSNRIFMEFV